MGKKKSHYINKKDFLRDIFLYLNNIENGIPESLWMKFDKLARKYATLPAFSSYTFKEDFIQEAIILCAEKAINFNPEISDNVFSFFDKIIEHCFYKNIKKEKREVAKQHRLLEAYGEIEEEDYDKYTSHYENGKLELRDNTLSKKFINKNYEYDGCKYGF